MTALSSSAHTVRANLDAWTTRLMDQYPGFDEYDLVEMIEEKTGVAMTGRDFEAVRAVYLRSKLRAWAPLPADDSPLHATESPQLFEHLPLQASPDRPYLDLYTLLPSILDLYPDWSEDDVRSFVEEKTRSRLDSEQVVTLRALYARLVGLRKEFAVALEGA